MRKIPAALAALAGVTTAAWLLRRGRPLSLAGKIAIVTGGSRGLGFLIARELGRAGCRVAITAREPRELELAGDRLRLDAIPTLTVVADHTLKADCERVIAEARRVFGAVDILVNNAGQIHVAPLEDLGPEHFKEAMDLMFWGVLHTTLATIPHMKARGGGAIVNITSFGGTVAVPHMLPYVSAKFAAVGLSQGLHAELKRYGIVVTTVAPSTMRTGSHIYAAFGGHAAKEYAWFKIGATLRGFSIDAERAARQIVAGLRHRVPFLTIGLPAHIGVRAAGLLPGITAEAMAGLSRLLPGPVPIARPMLITGNELAGSILTHGKRRT